jgi:Icc-related predicted phosphoesterase
MAAGKSYFIFVPFDDEVIMWVTVKDKTFYDDCNGIFRSNTRMHKVELPYEALDEAKEYTVHYIKMIDRRPYCPISEEERSITLPFRPVPTDREINIYHIADAHNMVDEPISAGSYFGDKIDLLVLNGDIPNHSGDIENFNAIYEIAAAITKGSCPVVFARGNHDTRGIHAEDMPNYIPIHNGRTYYSFRVGCVWGLLLDCGEDKRDTSDEYGHTICFHNFRLKETDFIKSVIANAKNEYEAEGVKHRIVISHNAFVHSYQSPFDIEKDIFAEWSKLLRENIKPEVMICGHAHELNIYYPENSEWNTNGSICPVVIGSTIKKKKPVYFAGCGYVFYDENIEVVFTDSNGETLRKELLHLENY